MKNDATPWAPVAWDLDAQRYRIFALVVLAVALGLRMYTLITEPIPMLWDDSGTYLYHSQAGFGSAWDRPLGYSWFLRILRAISPDLRLIVGAQAVLGIISTAIFGRTVLLLRPQARAASLLVMLLVAIWPSNLLLEQHVLTEPLFLTLVGCGLYALLRARGEDSLLWAGGAGLFWAIAVVVRAQGLYYLPVLALFLLLSGRRHLGAAVVFLVAAALPLAAYSHRYFRPAFGEYGIVASGGIIRFDSMIQVIRPEHAPDTRSADFIRRHMKNWQYSPYTSSGRITYGENSPILAARDELGLDLENGDLNRWAGEVAWRALRDHPFHLVKFGLRNLWITLAVRDMNFFQKPLSSADHSRRAVEAVYGVDASRWHELVDFAPKPLEPLRN
jgi:hypothetical protein